MFGPGYHQLLGSHDHRSSAEWLNVQKRHDDQSSFSQLPYRWESGSQHRHPPRRALVHLHAPVQVRHIHGTIPTAASMPTKPCHEHGSKPILSIRRLDIAQNKPNSTIQGCHFQPPSFPEQILSKSRAFQDPDEPIPRPNPPDSPRNPARQKPPTEKGGMSTRLCDTRHVRARFVVKRGKERAASVDPDLLPL